MKTGLISLLVVLAASFTMSQSTEDKALREVADANTAFTTSLYNALKKRNPGNLIFSPYSLSTVMAMVRAGAQGETAKHIDSTMRFPDSETLNNGYKALIASLKTNDKQFKLETANRIYSQSGFEMNQHFVHTLKNFYDAEATQLDFAKSSESANIINDFVSSTTNDKIKDLISADDLDSLTRLVLVNAIYFKGMWKNKFDPQLTEKASFYVTPNETVQVDMMRLEADLQYGEIPELNAQVVALPYEGDRLRMIILLPNKTSNLADLEERLKTFPLQSIPGMLRERKVLLRMPKFKLESTIDLKDPLTEMGLGSIFDENKANFSGIPANPSGKPLYISKAIQKAFIEVNEEGSEAAAATGTTIRTRRAAPEQPYEFIAEYPFTLLIAGLNKPSNAKENKGAAILFRGDFARPISPSPSVKDEL